MNPLVEVRVRTDVDDPESGVVAFSVPWDQLEAARHTFQQWGVYDVESGEAMQHAFGQMVVERGTPGRVWFDVAVTNDA